MKKHLVPTLALIALLAVSFIGGQIHAAQNRMVAARDQLRAARGELQAATADKGGHRERAIEIIDRAIGQVDEGIEFARTH